MFNFKHKDNEFFDLFVDSANYFNKGALLMNEVMRDYNKAESKMKEIIDLEHDADDINDRIIDKLNQTFITPIDREDIYALANGLDDGVDFLQGTIQRMVLYRTGEAREGAIELTQLLIESTDELVKAFTLLKNIKSNQHKILDHTRRIEKLESEGDRLYRKEVAHLFESCVNPIDVIKWKEVLEYLENTLDHCEDISDLIRGVVMKYA
ncbi:MAG: putative phosphate transport regulator [Firmicutes bacterium]|nr:putative phosphate transport regulator [Bacillota bacterium]